MPSTTTPTRVRDGVALPVPGTWRIDPGHAHVAFVGRHLVFTKVRGYFRDVTGTITIAEDPAHTVVEVTIGMASVESGNAARDEHLRSGDLLDVANHPTATFRGRARNWHARSGQLAGELTIKGVTKPVVLDVDYLGAVADPWGGDRAIFSATATVNRDDWGVSWNVALESGGLLVSKEIRIELELESVLDQG